MKPLCIVVGFGTGVGLGVARAFGKAGFRLGLISRNPTKYAEAIEDLGASGIEVSIEAADSLTLPIG